MIGLLVEDALDTTAFHEFRSLVKQPADIIDVDGGLGFTLVTGRCHTVCVRINRARCDLHFDIGLRGVKVSNKRVLLAEMLLEKLLTLFKDRDSLFKAAKFV